MLPIDPNKVWIPPIGAANGGPGRETVQASSHGESYAVTAFTPSRVGIGPDDRTRREHRSPVDGQRGRRASGAVNHLNGVHTGQALAMDVI